MKWIARFTGVGLLLSERVMIGQIWALLKDSVDGFVEDEALTRGAAIAFYTVTSIGPVLFIVVAIAGLFFGEDAASGAVSAQLGGLMGQQSADLLQTAIQSASGKLSGILATIVGIIALVIAASGVFTEMQQTLNVIWRAEVHSDKLSALVRSRATSLGLVAALGFLLLGPVDKPRPDADASEQDESDEAGGELVISGGDAPLLLEMRNEALNP